MANKTNPYSGFTLIELLVVIAIVGILAVGLIAIVNPLVQFQKTRDATRKSHLKQINDALDRYKLSYGKYPQAGSCAYGISCYVHSIDGSNWIPALVSSGELKSVPIDPINNAASPWSTTDDNYSYAYGNVCADGSCYDLTARLENHNDPDRCENKQYKFYFDNSPWCGSYSIYIYEASP